MPSQTFPCTATQLAHLRAELITNGVTVPDGSSGTITGRGIVAPFSYEGTALTVTIQSKPWYILASTIFGDI